MPSIYTTLYKSKRQLKSSGVATLNQNKPTMADEICSTNPICSIHRVKVTSLACLAQRGLGEEGHVDLCSGSWFLNNNLTQGVWKCGRVQHSWPRQVLIWKISSTIPGCGSNKSLGSAVCTPGQARGKEEQ